MMLCDLQVLPICMLSIFYCTNCYLKKPLCPNYILPDHPPYFFHNTLTNLKIIFFPTCVLPSFPSQNISVLWARTSPLWVTEPRRCLKHNRYQTLFIKLEFEYYRTLSALKKKKSKMRAKPNSCLLNIIYRIILKSRQNLEFFGNEMQSAILRSYCDACTHCQVTCQLTSQKFQINL